MRITHNAIRNAQRYSPDFVGHDYPAIGAALRRQILAGEEVPRDRLTVEITPGGRAVRLTSRTESGEPMGAIVVPDSSVDAAPGDLVCVTVGPLSGPAFTAPVAKPHSIALDEGTIRRIEQMAEAMMRRIAEESIKEICAEVSRRLTERTIGPLVVTDAEKVIA